MRTWQWIKDEMSSPEFRWSIAWLILLGLALAIAARILQ